MKGIVAESDVAIVGVGCKLPGATDFAAFRLLVEDGRCSVSAGPSGRWNTKRFLHAGAATKGFSYSFAGGYLDSIFDFDSSVFGISPREAVEMDPQQRLLLEVVYEALLDARLRRDHLADSEVGVYVGASSLDHGAIMASDPSAIDRYFMTGNTLSVVSNRLSHNFNWRGPSFTVDTACSSSMVALVQAVSDLQAGRVETAVVAGVNVLLNPLSFVGFSHASMLSPTGYCRPFSSKADGYVRSEGALAIVLQRKDVARPGSERAYIVAAGTNNDGRTSGIALPSVEGQMSLLRKLYSETGINPERLAFVEAHGTGTQVGDAVEATAIGEALGRPRSALLPVGSVKSNLGHLEPASGLAGIIKSVHALETRRLPRSLHIDELNPAIDFEGIGLAPARQPVELGDEGVLLCGVSSFGFGGSNAHVILRSPEREAVSDVRPDCGSAPLVISAASAEALQSLVADYRSRIAAGANVARLAEAVEQGRELLPFRAVLTPSASLVEGEADFVVGQAGGSNSKVCFAFSGNGAQWIGMGRSAYTHNKAFQACFDDIDRIYTESPAGLLRANLFDDDCAERFAVASFVQPLIYAVQSATAHALIDGGLEPDLVLGHSIGEIAAAEIAGLLTREDAIRIIRARADCQEHVFGVGRMAALSSDVKGVEQLLEAFGDSSVEIAADNGPQSVTVTGSASEVSALVAFARKRRIAGRVLELEYPFHSAFLDGMKSKLISGIGTIAPKKARIPFISTVTGASVGDEALGAGYWWRNFREPVLYRQAIGSAAAEGAGLFVEISPRPLLQSAINQTLSQNGVSARVICSLTQKGPEDASQSQNPISRIVAEGLANGACREKPKSALRHSVDRSVDLPGYPWQRKTFHFAETTERLDVFGSRKRHPLLGARLVEDAHEWHNLVDVALVPYLADHVVDGEIVVAGAALAEMALAVGREINPEGALGLEDFDILQAMTLTNDGMREVITRHTPATRMVEISSRKRFSGDEWTLHARGRLSAIVGDPLQPDVLPQVKYSASHDRIYAKASETGIDYGASFRLVRSMTRDDSTMKVSIDLPPTASDDGSVDPVLAPQSLDACFHALFDVIKEHHGVRRTYVPTRLGRLRVFRDQARVVAATVFVKRETSHSVTVRATLEDADGNVVADLDNAFLRSVVLRRNEQKSIFISQRLNRQDGIPLSIEAALASVSAFPARAEDGALLLKAHMRAVAHKALLAFCDADGRLDLDAAVTEGHLAEPARRYAEMLVEELLLAGLVEEMADGVRLVAESGLPEPERILRTFAAEYPEATSDLLLAGLAAAGIASYLSTGHSFDHRNVTLRQFRVESLLLQPGARLIGALAQAIADQAGDERPSIIVAASESQLVLKQLSSLLDAGRISLTIAGTDEADLAQAPQHIVERYNIGLLDMAKLSADGEHPQFDVGILSLLQSNLTVDPVLRGLGSLVRPKGLFAVIQGEQDILFDFYFGTSETWFASQSTLVSEAELLARIEAVGFGTVEASHASDDAARILMMRGLAAARAHAGIDRPTTVKAISAEMEGIGSLLRAVLPEETASDAVVDGNHVFLLGDAEGDERSSVLSGVMTIIEAARNSQPGDRLWFVVKGAFGVPAQPFAEAMWAAARTVMNEYPESDIRLIDLDPSIANDFAASAIGEAIAAAGVEREIQITPEGNRVVRVLPTASGPRMGAAEALVLSDPRYTSIAGMTWEPAQRRAPAAGEIEVSIIATGLNFRDVMLGTGLLDEEVLEGGATGGGLGFECSGQVLRVGADVQGVEVGDIVFGFAPNCFASHVTAPAVGFHPVPEGIGAAAAAAMPVAFLTAWYSLVEQARLKRGETVLIHGGAGGVGLAAIQIAKAIGARIIATVSTPDKDALARLYGADAIFDSRSLSFADNIRNEFGGVDVVLNSLFGDAMIASLHVLKPFGRFVELGKRDYVANTELGLRPFRRNLTYFGVDVDQLFAHAPDILGRGLQEMATGLADGLYDPLPCRIFEAVEVDAAFRLMQGAGHVGKIIVSAPPVAETSDAAREVGRNAFDPASGVQLIVGGTGGFGFATAQWLAKRGATQIVVASRRGRLADDCLEQADAIRQGGTNLIVCPLDVTDRQAVKDFVRSIAAEFGAVTGVYHTAMVLDDGLASNLSAEQIDRVLAPKVTGLENLDLATRDQPVDVFVMYSSIAALLGNPGQVAYAAANAFMHGVARRRRELGLPALAVGWGPIADVGELARNVETARHLETVTGVTGLESAEALDTLGNLLTSADAPAGPVVYFTRRFTSGGLLDLRVIGSPAFSAIAATKRKGDRLLEADIAEFLAGKSDEEAQKFLLDILIDEVTKILRLQPSEIDVARPLDELGLDSLMALEFRMSIENRVGLDVPLVAVTSVRNLHDLSVRMLKEVRSGGSENVDKADLSLYHMHGGEQSALEERAGGSEEAERKKVQV